MRIVDRKTFLAMPQGTVFARYQPHVFEHMTIKGKTIHDDGEAIDFFEQDIADAVECDDGGGVIAALDAAHREGARYRLDLECEGREGLYDDSQLYAVWERDDLAQLIERLKRCL